MSAYDNYEGIAGAAVELSRAVSKSAKVRNRKMMRRFMSEREIAQVGETYFLGAASAKVLHSAETLGYINVVQYLAPADRATTALLNDFPDFRAQMASQGTLTDLHNAFASAARLEPLWAPFTGSSPEVARREVERMTAIQRAPKDQLDYTLPDFKNRVLSLCPFASPKCREVCLNTSGQGGLTRTGSVAELAVGPAHQAGYTHTSDLQYLYLRGFKAFYGGESNSVTAARIRRTHVMWLSWMREGILENTYNEMLYEEAQHFVAGSRKLGVPMALRLNGTSDFPAHTLRVKGKNLMVEMAKQNVMCYDYTKHFQKMDAWMKAGAFSQKVRAGMKGGFPMNYHLVFSWSENNGRRALDVLSRGGNVVMVFRRSIAAGKKDEALPKEAGGKGVLPTQIALAQLGGGAEAIADVVDGDAHDLRFLDPYNVGKKDGGVVVGLIGKGAAAKPYTDGIRRKTWQHFTSPATLKRAGKGVQVEIRENPGPTGGAEGLGAVQEVDSDLAREATVSVDGWQVMPTNMAT